MKLRVRVNQHVAKVGNGTRRRAGLEFTERARTVDVDAETAEAILADPHLVVEKTRAVQAAEAAQAAESESEPETPAPSRRSGKK